MSNSAKNNIKNIRKTWKLVLKFGNKATLVDINLDVLKFNNEIS